MRMNTLNKIKTHIYFALIILIITQARVDAQQVEIFGYFEPQFMAARIKNEFYELSSNKLRVDFKYQPSDNVSFGANFDYISYHGKTQWNILEYLPENILTEVNPVQVFGYEINPYILPYEDRNFLDNAFVKLTFEHVDITIGKQQLSFGTGYAWNPTDVFNKKDVLDPTYEQPGHNAVRLEFPFHNDLSLTTIVAPTEDDDYTDILLGVKSRLGHFDFSLSGIQKEWTYTDARIFDPVMMNFYQVKTKRHILGGDAVGELLGLGVWAEYAYNKVRIEDSVWDAYLTESREFASSLALLTENPVDLPPMNIIKDYYEFVTGIDYTFDFETYFMCEYYRNTSAASDYKQYKFNDWMQLIFAETRTITRDQIYLFIQHPATDLINIGCSSIISLSDESSAIVPMMTYNIFENVDLTVIGNLYTGKSGTSYAKNLGNGGIFRLRVYF